MALSSNWTRSWRVLVSAAVTLTIATIVAVTVTVQGLRNRTEAETKAGLARLSLVLAEETSRSFQSVNLILNDVIEFVAIEDLGGGDLQPLLGSARYNRLLVEKRSNIEQVRNLIIIGAGGQLLNQSISWPVPAMSLATREQFKFLRDHDGSTPFISEPVINKLDGQWTVYVARRLNDRNGSFAGVVQAAFRLQRFEELYGAAALGEGGAISLLRDDGVLLARYPQIVDQIGKKREDPLGDGSADAGDESLQYVASRRVLGFPLRVSVAMNRDAVLGSWRRDAAVLLVGSTGAAIGVFILLWLLGRKVRKLRQSEALLASQNLELTQSRQLLLEAQRIGKLGHYISSVATDTAVWSPQLFEIAGLPPVPEVSFETLLGLVHPDDVADYLGTRMAALAGGVEMVHEHRWIRPDGGVRWVRLEGSARYGDDGQVTGFFGIIQDITERKQAEELAEQSRRRLQDAVESMPQGFVLYDAEGRFVLANTHFREMFPVEASLMLPGMKLEEIAQLGNSAGLSEIDAVAAGTEIERAAAARLASRPSEQRLADGRWIQFIDHRTSDGGTAGLRTDISAFKNVEAALEQKLADLERTSSELETQKAELESATANLTIARDAAEAANRAKSDFLAIMSHEIRTPLTGMVGMIDLLHETDLDEQQQRYTGMAKESATALLDVINNILDFSKLEASKLDVQQVGFELAPLLESITTLLGTKAAEKGLRLRQRILPGVPQWLSGDPGRIRQVLLNLVSNAIKFTSRGTVDIRVACRACEDGAVELRFDVVDTGIGIPPEVQRQLFMPFVQADTSISRTYGGSGLGLAICRQLCCLMGGEIGLHSTPGEGSRFWFTVRCHHGIPFVDEPKSILVPETRALDILVAEDSPIIATLIASLLKAKGFEPDMVTNGRAALEAVRSRKYDIVLMDVQMPEMDGITATRAIRNLDVSWRSVPIIALTANALVGQREAYLAAGMTAYVSKPIQPVVLIETIMQCAASQLVVQADGCR